MVQASSLCREDILSSAQKMMPNLKIELEVLDLVDSTNSRLMKIQRNDFIPMVCVAEQQSAGRGRRGRQWFSSHGSIIFSIRRRFRATPEKMMGLSLAAGIAVVEALSSLGAENIGLKWPNDILWRRRKLAGILVEMGTSGSELRAVIGLGMNYTLPETYSSDIGQPWANISDTMPAGVPDRNIIIGHLIAHLLSAFTDFEKSGLTPFVSRWENFDLLKGKQVDIYSNDKTVSGIALGIAEDGALRVQQGYTEKKFYAGEVSVRRKD